MSQKCTQKNMWNCELCGYSNNKYLTWCEMCLVLREDQENFLDELNEQLHATEYKSLYAQQIRDIATKIRQFKEDIKTLNNCDKEATIIHDLEHELKRFYEKRNLNYNENMVQEFIKEYKFDEVNFEEQKEINKMCHPICICGGEMISMKEDKCYNKKIYPYVLCDICDKKIPSKHEIHHCPAKKAPKAHPHGFDICEQCRKEYVHRLRYFVALIICPPMVKGKIECNDAVKLTKMFKTLGFHKIICIEGTEVTKQRIKQEIANILPPKHMKKNVNQFTAVCYSGHGVLDAYGNYYFDLNASGATTRSKYVPLSILQPLFTATYDIKYRAKNMYYQTYYRHNALLLINSCHSESASAYITAQIIADQLKFNVSKLLKIIGATAAGLAFVKEMIDANVAGNVAEAFVDCKNPGLLLAVSVISGLSLLGSYIVASTTRKSRRYESIAMITSCERERSSNFCYPTSPFVKYVVDYFDIFLNPKHPGNFNRDICAKDMMDTPKQLYRYICACYDSKDNEWKMSLRELGQTACYKPRGLEEFAICPMFNVL